MIDVGIIGAGFFGEAHARALKKLPGVRLVAASRRDPLALEDFTRQYGGRRYTHYADLLADPNVGVVVIATPHHQHTEIAIQAAQAGKHVLIEKPLAPSLEECDRILAAAEQAGVKLMVGHVNHFIPAYQRARQLVEGGRLGELVLGTSTVAKYWFEPNRRPWHLDRATGGGMLLTVGIHCLDRLTWLMGKPVERVAAQLATRFHAQNADDAGLLFLRFAGGGMGAVTSVGYRRGDKRNDTELIGTEGTLKIDAQKGAFLGQDEMSTFVPGTSSSDPLQEGLVAEWQAFSHYLENGGSSPVSGEFARHIMAVVFAAEESSRRKAEVEVPTIRGAQ